MVAEYFSFKKFKILRRNHWFQRHAEVDLWLNHKNFGTVLVEVKSLSAHAEAQVRLPYKQKIKLLRIARSLEASLWLAFVSHQKEISIYDVATGERIEC